MIRYWIPVKTISEANHLPASRAGAMAKWARTKLQREASRVATSVVQMACVVNGALNSLGAGKPVRITMTRVSFGCRKMDHVNLCSALKAIQDGIAEALGFDDGRTDVYDWVFDQQRGIRYHYAVLVEIDTPGVLVEFPQQTFYDAKAFAKDLASPPKKSRPHRRPGLPKMGRPRKPILPPQWMIRASKKLPRIPPTTP